MQIRKLSAKEIEKMIEAEKNKERISKIDLIMRIIATDSKYKKYFNIMKNLQCSKEIIADTFLFSQNSCFVKNIICCCYRNYTNIKSVSNEERNKIKDEEIKKFAKKIY